MTTQAQLLQVFNDNFMAYWRSHVAHVNIMGRNFHSDHELLGGIYEELQGQVDIIAELLRSMGEFMPITLGDVIAVSEILDTPVEGDSETLLGIVETDLMLLKGCYEELIKVANEEGYDEIANYAQDRVLAIAKHLWMLNSTLS
jgi:starvation-inducible DNA-binding protein